MTTGCRGFSAKATRQTLARTVMTTMGAVTTSTGRRRNHKQRSGAPPKHSAPSSVNVRIAPSRPKRAVTASRAHSQSARSAGSAHGTSRAMDVRNTETKRSNATSPWTPCWGWSRWTTPMASATMGAARLRAARQHLERRKEREERRGSGRSASQRPKRHHHRRLRHHHLSHHPQAKGQRA